MKNYFNDFFSLIGFSLKTCKKCNKQKTISTMNDLCIVCDPYQTHIEQLNESIIGMI